MNQIKLKHGGCGVTFGRLPYHTAELRKRGKARDESPPAGYPTPPLYRRAWMCRQSIRKLVDAITGHDIRPNLLSASCLPVMPAKWILLVLAATLVGCQPHYSPLPDRETVLERRRQEELQPPPPRKVNVPEKVNPEVNTFLKGLRYDPRQILAEQVGDVTIPAKPLPDEVEDTGDAVIVCKRVKRRLIGNLDDQLILAPVNNVVWPGALLKANQDLVDGRPLPVKCHRAPMWLSIDLPGIGEHGVFTVDDVSNAGVQTGIQRALDWWNNNRYDEGYVSKSRSQYAATIAYDSQQLAAALGVNYRSLGKGLSSQFQVATSRERMVAMAVFRQVFYTVSFEAPVNPGAAFHPSVTLDEVREQVGDECPPAYVSSVDYGRILMLRLETSSTATKADVEAALRYMSLQGKASSSYKKIKKVSRVTLITIGGNAEVNTDAVDATDITALHRIIRGKNALYSKSNPGEPIAYTVRFLKDDRLARTGFTTDYTEIQCTRYPHGWIEFKHSGWYVAKFYLSWTEDGKPKSWASGQKTAGYSQKIYLKNNPKNIHIVAQAKTGLIWQPWGEIWNLKYPGPPNATFTAKGTTLNRKYSKSP